MKTPNRQQNRKSICVVYALLRFYLNIMICLLLLFCYSARTDVEVNFPRHDKIIRRMIESSNSAKSNDPDTIQRDIDQLNTEIETLGEAARTKEIEWNNILYLKKMKEDMLLRLSRKRTIMEIMQSTKSIDNPESLFLNHNFDNVNESNAMESKKTLGNVTPATSFIMSRCNMKSVDLAKEKSNLNELHRFVADYY